MTDAPAKKTAAAPAAAKTATPAKAAEPATPATPAPKEPKAPKAPKERKARKAAESKPPNEAPVVQGNAGHFEPVPDEVEAYTPPKDAK